MSTKFSLKQDKEHKHWEITLNGVNIADIVTGVTIQMRPETRFRAEVTLKVHMGPEDMQLETDIPLINVINEYIKQES